MDIDVEFHFDEKSELKSNTVDETAFTKTELPDFESDIIPQLYGGEGFKVLGSNKTWEFKVATISNWPEFKTKTCHKRVKIPLDGSVKVPYPCIWRRTCKRSWYLVVGYSGSGDVSDNLEKIVKECAKIALIPALPILLTGNIGGAASVFLNAFRTCLIKKGIQDATKFSVSFDSRKTCGKWKRI